MSNERSEHSANFELQHHFNSYEVKRGKNFTAPAPRRAKKKPALLQRIIKALTA